MGEDIIDMDLNMEGGRKETDEEGKEIAAGTDRSASEQTVRLTRLKRQEQNDT